MRLDWWFLGGVHAQGRVALRRRVFDGDEIHRAELFAIDGEVVDLAHIVPFHDLRVRVVCVGAARREEHSPIAKAPGIALDPAKVGAVVDDQIAAGLSPKGT
jgi:hypothetical protein